LFASGSEIRQALKSDRYLNHSGSIQADLVASKAAGSSSMTPVATAGTLKVAVSAELFSPDEFRKMNAYWRSQLSFRGRDLSLRESLASFQQ
jgi:hypothetical protein